MFENIVDKVTHYDDDVFRNIPTILKSEDLLDDLSPAPEDRQFGEFLVSEPDSESLSPIITRPFQYGPAFGRIRQATRFSDGIRFGVWYGCVTELTAVYETVYWWQRRLAVIKGALKPRDMIITHRRVFKVHVRGMLIDILGKGKKHPSLVDKADYSLTHALGDYLHDQGANGLIYQSARYPEGVNIAAFKQAILSEVRHDSYLQYRWKAGGKVVVIEKQTGRTWKTIPSFI